MYHQMTSLEKALCQLKSYTAMRDVLHGETLKDLQCVDVLKAIARKKAIWIYDTGTGKTFLAAAAVRLMLNEDSNRRFIMFVRKDQLIQTPAKLERILGIEVLATAADAKSLERNVFNNDLLKYKLILLTHECLSNPGVMNVLYEIRKDITGIFIDEAHKLNNVYEAQSSGILKAMLSKFDYVWALTATPIESDLAQLAKLACLLDNATYNNPKKLLYDLKHHHLEVGDDPCFFINRSAKELGRTSKPIGLMVPVPAMAQQRACTVGGVELMQVCKGDGAVKQAQALVELLQSQNGAQGLVYISQQSIYDWVMPFLAEAGISFAVMQGETPTAKRAEIMDKFNRTKEIQVVLLSITTAIDLDCNFVIFYEFTLEVDQLVGRAHRGFDSKELFVYFMITTGSGEVDYFMKNIYDRCEVVQDILGKENSAVKDVGREVGASGAKH